jgi:hypothetical protein
MIGDLKSLQLLWLDLAQNQRYRPFVTGEDILSFKQRATNEGLSYLTQALPLLGKSLDRFHSTQEWLPPEGFDLREAFIGGAVDAGWIKFHTVNVPVFLGKAVESALNGNSAAVDCVRQLSYIFYKLEVKHDEGVTTQFLDQFINTDRDLERFSFHSSDSLESHIVDEMKKLIWRILGNSDPLDIVPSHGGGATACRTPNWEKYHKLRYFKKLDDVFSYSEYFFCSPTHLADELDVLQEAPCADPEARVCLVPKDSRGPRIISCEPAELMYIQQGLMRKLYKVIETHPLTRGQINFSDQSVNKELARTSSMKNDLATLDLSDASDRVSLSLVRRVFPPNWLEALEACRSEYTVLPDGRRVKLNKFAPMGSSCCFPVEALVFWACAQAALRISSGDRQPRTVYVYGDDIIIPSTYAEVVIQGLELVGLKVNKDKCFVDGPFRESCGGDYYLGVDVTPIRLRKAFGLSGTRLESTADFLNLIIQKFGYELSHSLVRHVEWELGYSFPRTLLALPGTLRIDPCASNDVRFERRFNKALQRYEHRVLRSVSKVTQHWPPNWGELLRKMLTGRIVESPDKYSNQLVIADSKLDPGQYTDPHSVRTKWAWLWLG